VTQDQADRLLADLAPGLSPGQRAAAEERGRAMTLEDVVKAETRFLRKNLVSETPSTG
jgi:hypothetical protein